MTFSPGSPRRPDEGFYARIFDELPALEGKTVLDLGCSAGHQAAQLAARGARVVGLDANEAALREAESQRIPNAKFRLADLRALPDLGVAADGIWGGFVAAYFPDLPAALAEWGRFLRPGGWIALVEIDDFFGHGPLRPETKQLFDDYARDALLAGRYDFSCGRKLEAHLATSGFTIVRTTTLEHPDLAFDGPAPPESVEAWRARFERMSLLRTHCGARFDEVRDELLAALTHRDHRCTSKVYSCLATRPAAAA